MTNAVVVPISGSEAKRIVRVKGHTPSFRLSMVLVIYSLIFCYSHILTENTQYTFIFNVFPQICLLLIFCYTVYLTLIYKATDKNIIWAFMFFVVSLTSFLVNGTGFRSLLSLNELLLCVRIFTLYPMRKKELKKVFVCMAIVVFALICYGNTAGGTQANKFNPNTCAFFLSMLFMASFSLFLTKKRTRYLLLGIICVGLQFVFGSRTALFGLLFFVGLCLITRKKLLKKSFVFAFVLILSISGIVLAYVYSNVLYPIFGRGTIVIFGKDLFTGRESIWQFTFESIKNNLLFGVGARLNEDIFLSGGFSPLIQNAHNQPIGTLAAFGLPAFILFYFTFARVVACSANRRKSARIKRLPVIFMVVITVMSYFDVYFLSEYNWLLILVAYAIIASLNKEDDKWFANKTTKSQKKVYNNIRYMRRDNDYNSYADL